MIRHGRFIALARQKVASIFPWWGETTGEPKVDFWFSRLARIAAERDKLLAPPMK
jgi:hypothetical protein